MKSDENFMALGEIADELVEQLGPSRSEVFVYVDIGSIDRERKTIAAAQTIAVDAAPSRARQRLKTGDVLVSMTRPNLNAVAIVPTSLDEAIGSTGFHVLRSKWMVPEYLYFLVQSQHFVDAMCAVVQGALYPAVRPSDIGAFETRVPPRPEHARIVDKLEELLSDLDAGVAELKAAQKKLAQYRQPLLKAAVEGRLTQAWREQHGEPEESGAQLLERILRERRARWEAKQLAKFEAQGKAAQKGWQDLYAEPWLPNPLTLPELPRGWAWSTLGQLTETLTSGSRDWAPFFDRGSCTFVMAQNVRPWRPDFSFRQFVDPPEGNRDRQRSAIRKDDLLVTIVGANTGQSCRVPDEVEDHFVCQSVALIRLANAALSEFVNAVLNSPEHGQRQFREMNYGAGRPHLSFEQLEAVLVPLPPLSEQEEILKQFEVSLEAIADIETQILGASRYVAAQRKNILQAAFSGQLVPQDPNDEPASVLLERIRADRAARVGAIAKRGRKAQASS